MAKDNCYGSPHFDVSVGCPPLRGNETDATLQTLEAVVKDYKKMHYDNLETYLRDLEGDVRTCVYGPFKHYKKHPHQRRLSNKLVMDVAVERLKKIENNLSSSKDFGELYNRVKKIDVPGYGLLAAYDFAIRYGFSRGLIPEYVYLHAGTLAGAKSVLPGRKLHPGDVLPAETFPQPLRKLNGLHLENLLCIYKKELKSIMSK